ncbi:hypothetical protein C4552_03400 [Candidatus Parcubacteria bacterium]|nr:MAG: hypothetical protein C4552_03400 [Candidatus Parcubacteria bacterium]
MTITNSFVEQYARIRAAHPELVAHIPALLATFRTCRSIHHGIDFDAPADLDLAFTHVIHSECSWCKANFERKQNLAVS